MSLVATRRWKHLLIAVTVLLLAELAVPAQAQTKITECGTNIKLPGNYVLANDLLNCPGDGIDITFGHVTLDLDNHQITGTGTGVGIKIVRSAPYSIQVVKVIGPASISNFDTGVLLYSSLNGELGKITCTGNTTGFVIERYYDSAYNQIHDNVATNNHSAGFLIKADWDHYDRNQAVGNSGSGFVLAEKAGLDNDVQGNIANQNGKDGIEAQSEAIHNFIQGNHAKENVMFDLADDNSGGCQNTWLQNSFITSNKKCIE